MRSFLLFRGSRPSSSRATSHSSKDLMPLPDIVNYLMLTVVTIPYSGPPRSIYCSRKLHFLAAKVFLT